MTEIRIRVKSEALRLDKTLGANHPIDIVINKDVIGSNEVLQLYHRFGTQLSKSKLRYLEFTLDGALYKLIQQNPNTQSKWAAMARQKKEVVQVLTENKYFGVYVDGYFEKYDNNPIPAQKPAPPNVQFHHEHVAAQPPPNTASAPTISQAANAAPPPPADTIGMELPDNAPGHDVLM